jgi:single-stranded-DNA-specific exonuclease
MRWQILAKTKAGNPIERRKEIIKTLLKSRGLKTSKQQEEFFNPKDPYQLTFQEVGISSVQLTKAVKRIKEAIKRKEKVIVYGDYDADGVCATAVMWEVLNKFGLEVMPYIPQRKEGYGLKVDVIDQMAKEGVKLIVTVDQGIVHSQQVSHAKKKKIDVIITDHHQPGEKKPRAVAIIHTTKLAGVGVAWFLASWLIKKIKPKSKPPGLDLVTIGTITDMMSLLGPNRSLVKFGLKEVRKTKRLGLLSLYQFARVEKENIGAYEIGFIIGPRINASGRMDDPIKALRLLCTRDENRAIGLAQEMDQKNRERQELTRQTSLHARNLWLKEDGQSPLIFIYHQSYEHGVVGLVASRLKDEFYRPAVVLAPREDYWVASARSVDGFSIVEAIRQLKKIVGDHGGHRLAAGFSVSADKLGEVKKGLIKRAEKSLGSAQISPKLKIEAETKLSDLNFTLYQELEKFAPFGQGNPEPVFITRKLNANGICSVGRDNQHLKFRVNGFEVIAFGKGEMLSQLSSEKSMSIAYNLILDSWNNRKKLKLRAKDIKVDKKDERQKT